MSSTDTTALTERIHEASDTERYELVRQAAGDDAREAELRRACRLLAAARATADSPELDDCDTQELALDLARGRLNRAALLDGETLDWVLASLRTESESAGTASARTRQALRAIAQPPRAPRESRGFRLPAFGAAAAAGLAALAVFALAGPSSAPWAEELGLSRWRVWRMPETVEIAVRGTVEAGRLAPPLFELPPGPSRRERDSAFDGVELPRLAHPRWEATAELRPDFAWTSSGDGTSEVILLGSGRKMLWSRRIESGDGLAYPADEPELDPGATYYWKVNRLGGERIVASPYAAFRTLDADERRRLEAELGSSGDHPFLQGSVYDRHGLYTQAAAAFAKDTQRDAARQARSAVLAKQGLAP